MSYAQTVEIAERALGTTHGAPIALTLTDVVVDYPGAAAVLLRCAVDASASTGLPASVIIKESRSEQQHLFREWANLEFLNALPSVADLVPADYGGDEDAQVLVMEDVAPSGTQRLGDIVEGDDPVAAEAALLAFNRALGRLHAGTSGADALFRTFPPRRDAHTTSRHGIHRVVEHMHELPDQLESVGVPISTTGRHEIAAATEHLINPGPFLTFVHGDPTPGNVLVHGDAVRFIDLETGGYRHALLDGASARIRYLYSVWARRMPYPLQRRLLAAYRAELARGIPEAADDERFNDALMACATAWLATILAYLPRVREADVEFGRSTWRQRIVAALEHFSVLAEDTGRVPALAEPVARAGETLVGEWGVEASTMRWCNAFANVGDDWWKREGR